MNAIWDPNQHSTNTRGISWINDDQLQIKDRLIHEVFDLLTINQNEAYNQWMRNETQINIRPIQEAYHEIMMISHPLNQKSTYTRGISLITNFLSKTPVSSYISHYTQSLFILFGRFYLETIQFSILFSYVIRKSKNLNHLPFDIIFTTNMKSNFQEGSHFLYSFVGGIPQTLWQTQTTQII